MAERMLVDGDEPPAPFPPVLVPELLGFTPQLLLDDITNIANQSVEHTISAMETFIERWAEQHAALADTPKEWDSTLEVEQGLAAFATLLEAHTDWAFDSLEAWALRNIFAVSPGLPVVAPHHKGLDLTIPSTRREELDNEIEELRNQIKVQRTVNRLYSRAVIKTTAQRQRSEQRRAKLTAFLTPEVLNTFRTTPGAFEKMFKSVSRLEPLDQKVVQQRQLAYEGARGWEKSTTGYINWAVGGMTSRSLMEETDKTGRPEVLRAAAGKNDI